MIISPLLMLTSCGPVVVLDNEVDAKVYTQALCEEMCTKHDECDPDPQQYEECTIARCTEQLTMEFSDPCFAEWDEFRRCLIERETCEAYYDLQIPTQPGSICHDFIVVFAECREQHPSPSDD